MARDATPLPAEKRRRAEHGLGVPMSEVRLHRGPAAAALARSHRARAVTIGAAIHLGTDADHRALDHELVHAAQNRLFGAAAGGVSNPSDAAEQEAERSGAALSAGRSPGPPRARAAAQVQRQETGAGQSVLPAAGDQGPVAAGPPSFSADAVETATMSNEFLNGEALRVDDWLRGHGYNLDPDKPEYLRLARRLRAERERRVGAGHFWMAQAGRSLPTVLYRLHLGGDRVNVMVADLAAAFGVPDTSLNEPIMTPAQFSQYLAAHGVETVGADAAAARPYLSGAGTGSGGIPSTTGGRGSSPPAHGPLLTTPLPDARPFPYGTAAEGPITAVFYPRAVTLPRAYPAYDAVRDGAHSFDLGFERIGGQRAGVVNQTIVGGEWISIKTVMDDHNATPDHIDSVVTNALENMVNKRGGRRDPVEVEPGFFWRMNEANPDSAVIHILVQESAASRVPQLQLAANGAILNSGMAADLPPQVSARVTAWQGRPPGSPEATPGAARPALTPAGEMGVSGLAGGVIAVTISGTTMLFDAADHPDWANELAAQGGRGTIASLSQTAIEQGVIRSGAAIAPGAANAAVRAFGRRFGAFFVSAAMESYDIETNEAFYHSDAERIVRPVRAGAIGLASTEAGFYIGAASVAPATAGALFILTSAGYGAAAGSAAPVIGTAIGFIVGLGVGIVAYSLLDAGVPGGRESWDHQSPEPSARTSGLHERIRSMAETTRAEQDLYRNGSALAGGINDGAMLPGFGLRADEQEMCLP
uniref:eCIS core domain-containing protein n=1 Tax=uncultured Sphingomonas sp. TaxID=158754 RepID=UPI0035CC161F